MREGTVQIASSEGLPLLKSETKLGRAELDIRSYSSFHLEVRSVSERISRAAIYKAARCDT